MQVAEMKTRLEEKIRTLEEEKNLLTEEVAQLREVVELSDKAKNLENEVDKLKKEIKTLKDRVPQEFLQELDELASPPSKEKALNEECASCDEEEELL